MNKIRKEEIVKALTELVQDKIDHNINSLGMRYETEEIPDDLRSKIIRAYIVDLFGDYSEVEGLKELEDAILESVERLELELPPFEEESDGPRIPDDKMPF